MSGIAIPAIGSRQQHARAIRAGEARAGEVFDRHLVPFQAGRNRRAPLGIARPGGYDADR